MIKKSILTLLLLLFIGCEEEESSTPPFNPINPDASEIEGSWRGIRNESHKIKWEFTFWGKNWILDDECGIDACAGTFELDNTTTPNQINFQVIQCATEDSYIGKAGNLIQGIYQLDIDTTINQWNNSLILDYALNIAIPDSTAIPDEDGNIRPESFSDQTAYIWETLDNINPNDTTDEGLIGCCNPAHSPIGYKFESESKYQYSSPTECSGDSLFI